MKKLVLLVLLALQCAGVSTAAESPLLLQSPSLSQTQIVFAYGGNLWVVAREGGDA